MRSSASQEARARARSTSFPPSRATHHRLGEQQPDVERKPDQMTLGVSFHYGDGRESTAESVAISPVCKRKSVLLPLFFTSFPSPFSSSSSSSYPLPSPSRLLLTVSPLGEIFTALQSNLLFVSNIFIISLFVVISAFVPDEETNEEPARFSRQHRYHALRTSLKYTRRPGSRVFSRGHGYPERPFQCR